MFSVLFLNTFLSGVVTRQTRFLLILDGSDIDLVECFGRKNRNYDFNERDETIWREAIFENEEFYLGSRL